MSDPFFNWYQTVERARRYEETVLQHAEAYRAARAIRHGRERAGLAARLLDTVGAVLISTGRAFQRAAGHASLPSGCSDYPTADSR
jgi:signal transduction histidine kinase